MNSHTALHMGCRGLTKYFLVYLVPESNKRSKRYLWEHNARGGEDVKHIRQASPGLEPGPATACCVEVPRRNGLPVLQHC